MDISEIKLGMEVMIVDAALNVGGPTDVPIAVSNERTPFGKLARVVLIRDEAKSPGKVIGLCLKEPFEGGNELDGACPPGRGWWSRPEHLYTPADRAAHEESTREWREQREAAMKLAREFLGHEAE